MMKTGGFFAGRRSHSVTLQPTSETSWLADFRVAPRWPSRRWAILALVGRVVKLEDHDIRAAILRMGRIVAISCCIRILGITTTNLHDLEWTALLAPVLKHVNCVGKSADEGRGDASSASCRHPAGAVLFRKDAWPSQACPCQELSSSAGPVEIAQGREPPGRAGRMQRFALAARLRADDPQHLFPVVLATEDASGVRPSGALDPEGPGRGGGINRHPLRAVALVEEAPVWFLALAMEPRRPAADGYLVTAREAAMGADCPFLPRPPF